MLIGIPCQSAVNPVEQAAHLFAVGAGLLIKVLLVFAMLALALLNRLRIHNCEQRLPALKASVTIEWLLGISAVAAVSLLGTLPPMVAAG